jgi:hypothetical protein
MTDIRTCPFCKMSGSFGLDHKSYGWVVRCPRCGIHGPAGATNKDAVELWNDRGEAQTSGNEIVQMKAMDKLNEQG